MIQQSRDGYKRVEFGKFGDIPVSSDYDGDNTADLAVIRDGQWLIRQSFAGMAEVEFGKEGDFLETDMEIFYE